MGPDLRLGRSRRSPGVPGRPRPEGLGDLVGLHLGQGFFGLVLGVVLTHRGAVELGEHRKGRRPPAGLGDVAGHAALCGYSSAARAGDGEALLVQGARPAAAFDPADALLPVRSCLGLGRMLRRVPQEVRERGEFRAGDDLPEASHCSPSFRTCGMRLEDGLDLGSGHTEGDVAADVEVDRVQAGSVTDLSDEVALLRPQRGEVVLAVHDRVADHSEVQLEARAVEERARRVEHEVDRRGPGGHHGGGTESAGTRSAAHLPSGAKRRTRHPGIVISPPSSSRIVVHHSTATREPLPTGHPKRTYASPCAAVARVQ